MSPLVLLCLSACRFLDFGGDSGKSFEFRFFWDRAPKIGPEDLENPGFDKDGNKIPSPEVYASFYMPDVTSGINLEAGPEYRMTPVIGVELFEFKLPYVRWFSGQIQAGSELLDFYIGKRFTSIVELTAGPWIGRDFKEDAWAWGIGGTLLRF